MRKLNVSVIIGIIVALVGAGLVFAYGRHVNNRISSGKHPVPVLVADEALTAGMAATQVATHVHVAEIPSAYVVSGALSAASALQSTTAQNAVLVGSVPRGGQISYSSFAQGAAAGRVQPTKGDVALSIQTPLSSGVARYLQPGQMVDLFVTYQGSTTNSQVGSRTKLFASGVKVLAVTVAQAKTDNATTDSGDDEASTPTGSVVVLLDLTPKTAEKVVNATTLGSIYLAYTTSAHDTTPDGATPGTVIASNR